MDLMRLRNFLVYQNPQSIFEIHLRNLRGDPWNLQQDDEPLSLPGVDIPVPIKRLGMFFDTFKV